MILEELYCQVDDFNQRFMADWEATLVSQGINQRTRPCQMSASEIMTIVILFHQKSYRNFKAFYTGYVQRFLQREFPCLLSYNRFVEQKKRVALPLFFFIAA